MSDIHMNWGIILHEVEEQDQMHVEHKLHDFADMLVSEAFQYDVMTEMAEEATIVVRGMTKNTNNFKDAFKKIHDEHPEVIYVAIACGVSLTDIVKNWCRELASENSMIVQFFDLDFILNDFPGLKDSDELDVYIRYINEKVEKLARSECGQGMKLTFEVQDLDVANHPTRMNSAQKYAYLEKKTEHLELKKKMLDRNLDCSLIVTGFPNDSNAFDVAKYFHDYPIQDVELVGRGTALVTMVSKIACVQACYRLKPSKTDPKSELALIPVTELMKAVVKGLLDRQYPQDYPIPLASNNELEPKKDKSKKNNAKEQINEIDNTWASIAKKIVPVELPKEKTPIDINTWADYVKTTGN
uniref:ThiF domain-containing protein n=1 Tax=Rhabditophanes sp. KR3021 TaxID=114890 RepID=A0AC35TUK7_9BILA